MKFGQLIVRKIIKNVATRCQILRLKYTNSDFGCNSALASLGELTALPRPSSWNKGDLLLKKERGAGRGNGGERGESREGGEGREESGGNPCVYL